ncbi:MAG TPA: hypothetical protein VMG34_03025 [Bacteroidota bacterium]|nr:hypothetical protein [Bacteroidota bacterium]
MPFVGSEGRLLLPEFWSPVVAFLSRVTPAAGGGTGAVGAVDPVETGTDDAAVPLSPRPSPTLLFFPESPPEAAGVDIETPVEGAMATGIDHQGVTDDEDCQPYGSIVIPWADTIPTFRMSYDLSSSSV